MNDLPRQKLHDIVAQRSAIKALKGLDPLTDAATCEGELQALCGTGYAMEINVLIAAVRESVPADIEAWPPGSPIEAHLQRLSEQLAEHHALVKSAARWVVEAWADALGVPVALPTPPLFFSTLKMRVLVRPQNDPKGTWLFFGETPGTLELPPDHAIGIRPEGVNYTNLKLWADSIEMPKRIHYLDLSKLSLADPCLEHLAIFKELKALNLSSTAVTGEGFAHLESLPLAQVNLSNCKMLSDQGLSHVGKLKRLRRLDLSRCTAITARGLPALEQLPKLKTFYLEGCTTLQEDALEPLAALPQLKNLDLSQTLITGLGFLHFRNNHVLQELALEGCPRLNDDGVAHLLHLSVLETLYLGNTAISDKALDYLAGLPSLRRLHLYNCRYVTEAKISAMPSHITILRDPGPRKPIILGQAWR